MGREGVGREGVGREGEGGGRGGREGERDYSPVYTRVLTRIQPGFASSVNAPNQDCNLDQLNPPSIGGLERTLQPKVS